MLTRNLNARLRDSFAKTVFVLVSIVFVAIAARPGEPAPLICWDWLLITGVLLLALGIVLAGRIPEKLRSALARLADRNAIQADGETLQAAQENLEKRAKTWSQRGGVIVAVSILAAFVVAGSVARIPLAVFEACWGYIAGCRLGRLAAYGGLGDFIKRAGISIKVTPGHIDGAAGLKPIGDFFFRQSMIVAIPAMYLAVWSSLIPHWPRTSYLDWRDSYVALLALSIVFEVLAFVIPMWSFHSQMWEQRQNLLHDADKLSVDIASLESELGKHYGYEERKGLEERLSQITKQYWNIENMPTWPVSYRTKRIFTVGNAALLLPVLSDLMAPSWRPIIAALGQIFAPK